MGIVGTFQARSARNTKAVKTEKTANNLLSFKSNGNFDFETEEKEARRQKFLEQTSKRAH